MAADAAAPTRLRTLADARGEPMGEWAAEPMPGARGRWVRLTALRANEWSPAVRAGREEEVARAVAALDLELALFPAGPAGPARDALRELVEARAMLFLDPLTAETLEAFGWDSARRLNSAPSADRNRRPRRAIGAAPG